MDLTRAAILVAARVNQGDELVEMPHLRSRGIISNYNRNQGELNV